MKRALVIQTAFPGDVILTLPLVQVLKRSLPDSQIDFVAIPATVELLRSHPDISNVLVYDKHGDQKSFSAFLAFGKVLKNRGYDFVFCPHRSLRSALLTRMAYPQIAVGFDKSAMKLVFTHVLPWKFGVHEIERNLSLLRPIGISFDREEPRLYPNEAEKKDADDFLRENRVDTPYAVVAPGTVWPTKQYPVEMMAEVAEKMLTRFEHVLVVGGKRDESLIPVFVSRNRKIISAIGKLSLMASAELIRGAAILIANDSAPVHIASAFNTPAVAIFGPTVRRFGFYPYHSRSAVAELENLGCRPCSIHGGRSCPIGTFECMRGISPDVIVGKAMSLMDKSDG